MDQQFQLGLLCYLVQSPNGETFIDSINDDTFELLEFKFTSQLLKRFYKLKHRMPGNLEATAFLEEEITNTKNLPEKTAKALREVFEDIYFPLDAKDKQFIEDRLIVSLQSKELETLGSKFAKGELTPKEFMDKLAPVSTLALPGAADDYKQGSFLVADREKNIDEQIEGHPTFLYDLNKLTSARGFYSPQLIVLMSGPKYFKTGLLIKLGVEYARDGLKVYYADGENGARSIRNRMKQTVMECELSDLYDSSMQEDMNETLRLFGFYMGGDIFVDYYPAGTKSVKDVRERLSYLKSEYGFVPDMIIWDNLEHFIPSNEDDRRRDTRIKIQLVYHEAIALNNDIEAFAFTPSQVNRKAISKKILDMTDIAEDFGKVMNAHAVFAICATDEEMEEDEEGMSTRRIIPIAQREGVGYKGKNMCIIKVAEDRQIVREAELVEENLDLADD